MDFVKLWSDKTGIVVASFLLWLGLASSKWASWKHRYGKANEHNAWIPRDHWLDTWEKQAILRSRLPLARRGDIDYSPASGSGRKPGTKGNSHDKNAILGRDRVEPGTGRSSGADAVL